MTTPSEEEARAEAEKRWPQEWFYTEGSTDPNFTPRRIPVEDGRRTGFVEGAIWAASRVSTPPSEDWELRRALAPYLSTKAIEDVLHELRTSVPAVPVLPTEPEGGSFQPLGDGFYRVAGVARDAMTGRYKTGSTEPEEKR